MAQASVPPSGAMQSEAGDDSRLISQRQRALRSFTKNRAAVVGVVLIVIIIAIAVGAPLFAPDDPLEQSVRERLQTPGGAHLVGTDDKGRDIFSRIIYGTRVALEVGLFSVLLGGSLGTTIGIVAMTVALWPTWRRHGSRLRINFDWRHPAIRRTLSLSGWSIGYVLVNQLAFVVVIRVNAPDVKSSRGASAPLDRLTAVTVGIA